jgi:hypothetical protein
VRFSESLLETVGFLVGDRDGGVRGPIGTFFVIQEERAGWDGQMDSGTVRWMVTARHVVEAGHRNGGHITARMRSAWRHGLKTLEWAANSWEFDPDDSLDLAIRPLGYEPANTFKALPIAYAAPPTQLPELFGEAELGHPTFFAGLLDWGGPLAAEARPIVRSGTVAAVRQPGIVWHTDDGKRAWTAPLVHLIDVRSFGGFSGSPCWIQWYLSYARPEGEDLPLEWQQSFRGQGGDPALLSGLVTMTNWWGVFVAHEDQPGVGIVIPASRVSEMLELPEIRKLKNG